MTFKHEIGQEGMLNLVTEADEALVVSLTGEFLQDLPLGKFPNSVAFCRSAAINALGTFRKRVRMAEVEKLDFPVRKAVEGIRYYWRLYSNNGHVYSAFKEGSTGTLSMAKAKAREYYVQGIIITELIPPDIDPTSNEERERQKNTSGYQPPGLNVSQRTKKH